jgi:hypothetical protein
MEEEQQNHKPIINALGFNDLLRMFVDKDSGAQ